MPGFAWRREKSLLMPHARKYPKELLDRGARLVFESGRPIAHVARDLGIESETLRKHVRQVEADEGRRKDVLSSHAAAESFVDTFKTDLIADRTWTSRSQLELAIVSYVAWFNNTRLHESLGDRPPQEIEELYAVKTRPTVPDKRR